MIYERRYPTMSRQSATEEDHLIWPAGGQPNRKTIARTSVAYWREKVFKVTSKGGGESPHYSVRIAHQKRRIRFPLYTPNKEAASAKAAQIFGYLIEHGWEATIAEYKPHTIPHPEPEDQTPHTVGDLLKTNLKFSSAREQTLHTYTKAMRRIVAGVMEIGDGKKIPISWGMRNEGLARAN